MNKYKEIARNILRFDRSKGIFLVSDILFYGLVIALFQSFFYILNIVGKDLNLERVMNIADQAEMNAMLQEFTLLIVIVLAILIATWTLFIFLYTLIKGGQWNIYHNKKHKVNYYLKLFGFNFLLISALLAVSVIVVLPVRSPIPAWIIISLVLLLHMKFSCSYAKTQSLRKSLSSTFSKKTTNLWYVVIPYIIVIIWLYFANGIIYSNPNIMLAQNMWYAKLFFAAYIAKLITVEVIKYEA